MDGAEPRPDKTGAEVAEELADDERQRQALRVYASAKFGIPGDEADDLVQETILHLLRTRVPVQRPRGFVLTLFHARCCDHLDKRRMRHQADSRAAEEREPIRPGEGAGQTIDLLLAL